MVAALATLSMWPRIKPVTPDSVNYMAAGTNLLRHGRYETLEGTPEVLFPPGYPLLIGLVDLLVHDPESAGRLVSATLSLATVPLLYWVGSLAGGRILSFWSALLLALLPLRAMTSVRVLSGSTYLFSALCAVALWLLWRRAAAEGRRGRALLCATGSGLLLGGAYLTRPEGLLVGLTLLAAGLLLPSPIPRRIRFHGSIATAAALAAVMAPYVLFLHQNTGEWTISGKVAYNRAMAASMAVGDRWAVTNAPELLPDETHARPVVAYDRRPTAAQWAALVGRNAAQTVGRVLALYGLMVILVLWGLRALAHQLDPPRTDWLAAGAALVWPVGLVVLLITEDRLFLPLAPAICLCAAAGLLSSRRPYRIAFALGVIIYLFGLIIPDCKSHEAGAARLRPDRAFGRIIASSATTGPVVGASREYAFFAGRPSLPVPNEPIQRIGRYCRNNGAHWLVVETSDRGYHQRLLDSLRAGPLPPGVKWITGVRLDATHEVHLYAVGKVGESASRGSRVDGTGFGG